MFNKRWANEVVIVTLITGVFLVGWVSGNLKAQTVPAIQQSLIQSVNDVEVRSNPDTTEVSLPANTTFVVATEPGTRRVILRFRRQSPVDGKAPVP